MPFRRALQSRLQASRDTGTTLVELVVAMTVMVTFFSVFTTIIVKIFDSTKSQQARSLNLDSTRNIVEVLDRQVRYANAVNTPVDTGTSLDVLWQAGSLGGQQTCYHWRVKAGLLQYRSWLVPATAAVAVPTAWTTVGNGVTPEASAPVFSITAPLDPANPAPAQSANRQQLRLDFLSAHGTPAVGQATRLAFTALNTRSAAAPASAVCQGVAL